jgi:hypothetical protein
MSEKPPAVELGEAREGLQRALLFGGVDEIAAAEARLDVALDRWAQEKLKDPKIAAIIRETLAGADAAAQEVWGKRDV